MHTGVRSLNLKVDDLAVHELLAQRRHDVVVGRVALQQLDLQLTDQLRVLLEVHRVLGLFDHRVDFRQAQGGAAEG